jgi:hypothetical protein
MLWHTALLQNTHLFLTKNALYNSSFWFDWIVCTIHTGSYLNSSITILLQCGIKYVFSKQSTAGPKYCTCLQVTEQQIIFSTSPNSTNAINVHNTICWAFFSICNWFTDCSKGSIQVACMFWYSQSTPLLIQCHCIHLILNKIRLYLAAN